MVERSPSGLYRFYVIVGHAFAVKRKRKEKAALQADSKRRSATRCKFQLLFSSKAFLTERMLRFIVVMNTGYDFEANNILYKK